MQWSQEDARCPPPPLSFSPYYLRQGFSQNQKRVLLPKLDDERVLSPTPTAGVSEACSPPCLTFSMDTADLNAGPQVYRVSTITH